ncbi:MAG: peptidyl-prolyl cis-trans isomerase [Desulfobacterales bacterium]
MKRILKEPLLHFLILGAGLFLLYGWKGGPALPAGGSSASPSLQVVVTQNDIRQMAETFAKTWQRPPTEAELQGLIESFVRDEITYREALAAGLDRDDSVIRRRLRLKMEFIYEDIAAQREPTEEELQAYMERHPDTYRHETQLGFRQVFVDADRRGAQAESEARAILGRLNSGGDPNVAGDPFLLGTYFPQAVVSDIAGRFGPDFAAALLALTPGQWAGPLRSGFGWHLIRVEERIDAWVPGLDEIREVVEQDWARARQQELRDAAYARLRERYKVVVESSPAAIVAETPMDRMKEETP